VDKKVHDMQHVELVLDMINRNIGTHSTVWLACHNVASLKVQCQGRDILSHTKIQMQPVV
jgi:hypothetical protein